MNIDFNELGIQKGAKVIVAMSGGVDSSVTAFLAKKAGFEVIGITLKMFNSKSDTSSDAAKVAEFLDIPWFFVDYSQEFEKDIISYFIREYKFGRTPNPCSRCNRMSKTTYLFDQMQKYGANHILTGHYARTELIDGNRYIKKAAFLEKDQSYYLSMIEPFHVGLMAFPLGSMPKSSTREIARENNIPVAEKPDSQEVCFLEGVDYRDYLKPYIKNWRKGKFILNGEPIGENKGIENYTVGQRRGLEISHSEPLYVKSIDPKTADVYLGIKNEVFSKGVALTNCSFFPKAKLMSKVTAKLRYRMNDEPCVMEQAPDGRCYLLFDKPQFAPAPGQTATIYDNDIVLGGGVIEHTF